MVTLQQRLDSAGSDGRTENRPVSSISGLYQRFRLLIHEGFKFLVVGGVGALITIGGAGALEGIGRYKAITIATIAATVATFLGNRYWTFRHRQGNGTARDTVVFFILNGVGLLIYYACIGLIQDVGDLKSKAWYYVALFVGTALGTLFRFWSYRKWVWIAQPAGPGVGEDGLPESLNPAPNAKLAEVEASQPYQDGASPTGRAAVRSGPGSHRRV
jgi:putative flippase GtrA